MQALEFGEKCPNYTAFPDESPCPLTLMDLFTALCEETEDDTLVTAAVIHLFRSGYVKFRNEPTGERIVFG